MLHLDLSVVSYDIKYFSRFRKFYIVLLILSVILSCERKNNNAVNINKTKDKMPVENRRIISAPIVRKPFIKKNGEKTNRMEFYLRRSIQDYFIKICECKVDENELSAHVPINSDEIHTLRMDIEFRNGAWDDCDPNEENESRMGEYAVIHRIDP